MAVTALELAEARVRETVELELGRTMAARETSRLRLEDQDWVYQLVGRLVADEHRRGGFELSRDQCEELWRTVFGAVTLRTSWKPAVSAAISFPALNEEGSEKLAPPSGST